MLTKSISFLKAIKENNNRDWFKSNKKRYEEAREEFKGVVAEIEELLKQHDNIDESGTKIFRIYRDVRFSNDKTPYNRHFSASFKRATNALRGGYYLRIEPGASLIVGGFFGPNSEDLQHIRKQIAQDSHILKEAIHDKSFIKYFGELYGERVKTSPKGFSKDDPEIDLIRMKSFMGKHEFSDEEVQQPDFAEKVNNGFKLLRPFFDAMTEYLTTDLNGVSLID